LNFLSGHVVRIAPNELSFDTVASRNDIYSHRVAKHFIKGPIYDGFSNGGERALVAIRDPVVHGKKRRFLAHAFSAQALKSQEPIVHSYCDLFVRQVEQYSRGPEGVNLVKWYNWFTFDVIGDLAFGEAFGCLESGEKLLYYLLPLTQSNKTCTASDHPWVSLVLELSASITWIDLLRRFPLVQRLGRRFMMRKEVLKGRREHYKFSQDKVTA
jgi:cytochrome P450